MEIERRFLIKNDRWKEDFQAWPYATRKNIIQGYLSFAPKRTIRVRTVGREGFLTIKGLRQNGENEEVEISIPYKEAQRLLNTFCSKPVLQKERYTFPKSLTDNPLNLFWEIDIYHADWEGLEIVEIEVPNIEINLILPDWVGEEITNDATYFNSNLALEVLGVEEWKEIH